jgi:hypothetical protein
MNDFELSYMQEAERNGYVMIVPANDNALSLRQRGFLNFVDAAGRFGYVRATLTDAGREHMKGLK